MPEKTEQEKFLEVAEEPSVLDQPLNPEKEEAPKADEPEEKEETEEAKNRRERRLMARLQAEKESNIALNARLEALAEARQATNLPDADYLKKVERIYGTDSAEAKEATHILADALKGVKEEAKQEALAAFREEQEKAHAAVREEEKQLDSFIDEIEDEHNISLSKAEQQGFFKLLEKMSPKDSDGNITAYADPHAVFEIFQEKTAKKDTRAKDLSSRSMVQGGASGDSKIQDDAATRQLREMGII